MTAEARPARWASPLACALIVVVLSLPRLVFAARTGLIPDEAYYAIWSFHPGFGYYDHSPAVAWFIWLGRALFGESEWAVRSLFYASGLVTCAALYRMGVALFGDRRIGAAAAIAYSVTIGLLISFAVATPDGPSTLFWTLAIWAVAEFTRGRNANWWLAAGLFAGLGLLSKYTVVFLGAGMLLYLVTSRERLGWLKLWQVWAGGLLAVLLFAPVLWIYAQRDWNSFRYQLGRSNISDNLNRLEPGEFVRFLVEESIQLLPTLFIAMLVGVGAFFARHGRALALPILTSAPMAVYFLVDALFGRVNPNWTAPLFPQLALIGAWALIAVRPRARWARWPLDALRLLHLPLGILVLCVAFVAIEYRALPFVGPLPVFDFVYGWDNFEAKLSALAQEHGAEWIDTENYSLNGQIGYYARMADDPLPVYETAEPFRYAYMPPMDPALKAAPHLYVDYARGPGDPSDRGGMTALGTVTRDFEGRPLGRYWVYLVK